MGTGQEISSGLLSLSEESEFGVLRQSYKGKYIALNVYVGKEEKLKM